MYQSLREAKSLLSQYVYCAATSNVYCAAAFLKRMERKKNPDDFKIPREASLLYYILNTKLLFYVAKPQN